MDPTSLSGSRLLSAASMLMAAVTHLMPLVAPVASDSATSAVSSSYRPATRTCRTPRQSRCRSGVHSPRGVLKLEAQVEQYVTEPLPALNERREYPREFVCAVLPVRPKEPS
jgi:hypothetical protein